MLAFSNDYYGMIFRATQSVELFCAYEIKTSPVVIGKNVWIGANTTILAGTHIGDNCVIAAGSVIKGDIEKSKLVIQKRSTEIRTIEGKR